MPSTYTGSGIELVGDGEQSGSWGTTTNNNMQIINRLISEAGVIALAGTTHTLTISDGTLSDGQYSVLVFGGAPSGTNTVTISPNDAKRVFIVSNTSGQSVVLTQGSGGNVTVVNNGKAIVYCNGAGSGAAVVDVSPATPTLAAIGLLTPTDGNFIVGNGSTWVAESGNTVLQSMGVTATATELNVLDGITASTTELNYTDGVTANIQTQLDVKAAVTTSISAGAGLTGGGTLEANRTISHADTSSQASVDNSGTTVIQDVTLDTYGHVTALGSKALALTDFGVTSSAAELNKLNGMTTTTVELNYVSGVASSIQTQLNSKAAGTITVSAGAGLTGGGDLTANRTISHADTSSQASVDNSGTTVIQDVTLDTYGHVTALGSKALALTDFGLTATSTELNYTDGVTSSIQTQLDNKQPLDADLTALSGLTPTDGNFIVGNGTTWVAESGDTVLQSIGVTATATELNYTDGVTSNIQTQLNTKAATSVSISAGAGLTGGGDLSASRTISHADTSSQGSVDNSGSTFIQDITLDTYGHVTGIGSATISFPAPTTNQVLSATAGASYGAVGTYGLFYWSGAGQQSPAATVAGSSLSPASTWHSAGEAGYYTGAGSPSGTWLLMGSTGWRNGTSSLSRVDLYVSVFLRVS